MKEIVITSAVRTPIGKLGGALKDVLPEELLRISMQGAINKSNIDKKIIDEVISGQAKQSTDCPNISRIVSLALKIPESVPSYTVHRQCASGMQAILNGAQQIQTGYSEVILCGGVESMSTAPFYVRGVRFGVGNGNKELIDPNTESQPKSQPNEIYGKFTMIETADNVARKYKISREEQDEYALKSQEQALKAIDNGKFKDEIVTVKIKKKKRKDADINFDTDEYPRRNSSLDKLSRLNTIFENGFVTAGNASGRNDGSSALTLMSKEKADQIGVKPLIKIIGASVAGVDPRLMGTGPIFSTRKLMKKLEPKGIGIEDFGLIEINEAFASQTLACIKELKLNKDIVNVNGGAIALGHPLGCSGARIVTTLIHEMIKRDIKYGLATICVAGGLGMSMALENISKRNYK